MSENSQGKPFKTLKLTPLKSAGPAGAPVSPPVIPPIADSAAPEAISPVTAGETRGNPVIPARPEPAKSTVEEAAPAAAAPAFNLRNFKPVSSRKTEDAPAAPESAPGEARPALSPSAAVSGPPGLKPFKFLVPTVTPAVPEETSALGAHKPQEIKLARASSSRIDTPSPFPVAPAGAPDIPGVLREDAALATPAKVVAAPSARRPMVVILVAVGLLLVTGLGAMLFLSTKEPKPSTRPVEVPVESVAVETPGPAGPVTPPAVPGTSTVFVPRTRDPGLEAWLAGARVTTVATQRVTLNERIYTLGSAVNPEGTLRWIGRDSVTKDLLFIDKGGVVYTKTVGGGR